MKRKIIQIFVANNSDIGALCDDGTVWLRLVTTNKNFWIEVDISQLNPSPMEIS